MGRILQIMCGAVLAVALGASQSANPVGQEGGRQSRPTESKSAAQEQARPATPPVEDSLQRIARHVEASQTGPEAQKGEDRADRDLDAQVSMARWAKWMFFAAAAGTVLSGVGVFLIWRTLIYTRKAAGSADEIVKVTRESAERQMRAYVGISDVYVSDILPGERPRINYTIRNAGQTPAKRLMIRAKAAQHADPRALFVKGLSTDERKGTRTELGPHHSVSDDMPLSAALSQEDYWALREGRFGFVLAGYIIYHDVFGRTRRLTFRAISRKEDVKEGRLSMYRFRVRST